MVGPEHVGGADSTAHTGPSIQEWRRLYAAAGRIAEIAPWQWMTETDIFGVRDTESDLVGFVSLMGRLGEHLAVAVYLEEVGLAGFWELQDLGSRAPPEAVLQVPHLQASFEDRDVLTSADLRVIRALELKFRGRQSWPRFRSYRPGWLPWVLDAPEARFLTLVLEQTAEFAERFRLGSITLDPGADDRYLVRVPQASGDVVGWSDEVRTVVAPAPEPIPVYVDPGALERLKRIRSTRMVVQVAFIMAPFRVEERGQRPYVPLLLLVVDADSGMILGSEAMPPQPTIQQTWGMMPLHLGRILAQCGVRPQRIEVQSERLARLVRHMTEPLGVPVRRVERLPAVDEAVESLTSFY